MSDIFLSEDTQRILRGKNILLLGGSVTRGLYKDLICLLNTNALLHENILRAKREPKFPDFSSDQFTDAEKEEHKFMFEFQDQLEDVEGGRLHRGRNYTENRTYINPQLETTISFSFITAVWSDEALQWILQKEKDYEFIDVIIISSCLWDVNRRGPTCQELYEENLHSLVGDVSCHLPNTRILWLTSLPVASETNSKGMSIPGLEFQNFTSKFSVVEANHLSAGIMRRAGFNVIDLHFELQGQTSRRYPDGIHWPPIINRMMTNHILTNLTLSLPSLGPSYLPGRRTTRRLEEKILSMWKWPPLTDQFWESF